MESLSTTVCVWGGGGGGELTGEYEGADSAVSKTVKGEGSILPYCVTLSLHVMDSVVRAGSRG